MAYSNGVTGERYLKKRDLAGQRILQGMIRHLGLANTGD